MRKWELRRRDKEKAEAVSRELGVSRIVADILAARGMEATEDAREFLSYENSFADPFILKDMDKAVERINRALELGEKICIYGDYDCDGITSTALLYSYFESIGADICYYIPDREKEGYGLNKRAVKAIKKFGAELIVTVDNGIAAGEEIDYAAELGVDVVVTDHHKQKSELPRAVAVVDPHRTDESGNLAEFAGVGVAFKLVCALENDDGFGVLERYGDLIAIGTVADITPLKEENRFIVKRGLELIENTENAGIRAIMEIGGLTDKKITSESIGFGIAPRINSAARLGDPKQALTLLLCDDEEYAAEIAQELEELSLSRKEEDKRIMEEVERIIKEKPEILYQRVMVIWGEGWHNGVIGITAAKILEKYGKPCILISINGEEAKGSARSIEGFSIIDAISSCGDKLLRYGGHAMAAGLTVKTEALEAFCEGIQQYAEENYEEMPQYVQRIDRLLHPSEITVGEISKLSALEPFGCANESPVFAMRKLTVEGIYPIGDNKHIRLKLGRDGTAVSAVYFGVTAKNFPFKVGEVVDIAVACSINEYNGEERVTVRILDIRLSELRQEMIFDGKAAYEKYCKSGILDKENIPDREDFSVIYKYLRNCNGYRFGYERLCERVSGEGINYCKMRLILDVFADEGLIEITNEDGTEIIEVAKYEGRADIFNSEEYKRIEACAR